jgi:hypothetical protein
MRTGGEPLPRVQTLEVFHDVGQLRPQQRGLPARVGDSGLAAIELAQDQAIGPVEELVPVIRSIW